MAQVWIQRPLEEMAEGTSKELETVPDVSPSYVRNLNSIINIGTYQEETVVSGSLGSNYEDILGKVIFKVQKWAVLWSSRK